MYLEKMTRFKLLEIIFNMQESYKNTTKNTYICFTQIGLLLIFYPICFTFIIYYLSRVF